ncbi:MAG: DUF1631 family protein [Pseudomonadales bacterium]|nr:DUF1631 family protein [Pseudomonadales bacterium]
MGQNVAQTEEIKNLFQRSFAAELEASLDKLFQSADSAVLKLACEASENKEQNRFFEAAQALRIVRSDIKAQFIDQLNDDELTLDVDLQHMQSLRALVSVQVDDVNTADAERNLSQRLRDGAALNVNPLAADYFIECFLHSLANTEFDIHIKMLVLRLFEAQTFNKLALFTELANQSLVEKGILPDLKEKSTLDVSVDDILTATLGLNKAAEAQDSFLEEALSDLQADQFDALEQQLQSAFVLSAAVPEARDFIKELMVDVSVFEIQDIERVEVIKQLFATLLLDDSLPAPARVLLAYLQLPFARIALLERAFLHSQNHPAKTLLSLLADLVLVWQPSDVADEFINDRLFIQLQGIIQALYEAERILQAPFAELLFSLIALAEEQRQRSAYFTQQVLESANAASSSGQVRERVDKLIAEKTQGLNLPAAVQRILYDGWAHVLYVQGVADGIESDAWHAAVDVIGDLLASVRPVEQFAHREDFLNRLPALLQALRLGMYVIELSSTLIHQLLADLECVHKAMIVQIKDTGHLFEYAGSALLQAGSPSAIPLIEARKKQAAEEAENKRKLALQALQEQEAVIAEAAKAKKAEETRVLAEKEREREVVAAQEQKKQEAKSDNMQLLASIGQGVWLIWHKQDKKERCQIAAHIKHMHKYILTNSSGRKIAEVEESDMADYLASGQIELAESGYVFEKALESVIGGIRDKR